MGDFKGSAMMNQGQRLRYLKTGGIIAFVLLVLYFIAPSHGLSRGSSMLPSTMYETPG
jgi:guanosine-diphosphatase